MSAHAYFAGDWLALREPLDHASRDASLTTRAARALDAGPVAEKTIVDLGCGSGSNLRYLAPRLPGPQRWHLLDHDRTLLDAASAGNCRDRDGRRPVIETHETNLADMAWHTLLDDADLVTASALFDLVTADWVDSLAEACAQRRLPALFVLSVDGAIDLQPSDPEDPRVLARVQAHQARDKSFGAALGTDAPRVVRQAFSRAGYAVHAADAVWVIDNAAQAAVATALVTGWRDAAIEQSPSEGDRISQWAERRCRQLRAGKLRITVGHQDLFAMPGTR